MSKHALTVPLDILADGIAELGLDVNQAQQTLLIQYLALLEKWNQVYNLTAIRDVAKMVSAHLLDSLSILPYLHGGRILDVGTGAGLPGIPLAIARPEWSVTLLDSNHKKSAFLRQAITELKLENADVACERIEAWTAPAPYDVIVSRAFSDLGEFLALSGRLLAPGGTVAAMKGLYPFEELERIPAEFKLREVKPLRVPGLDAERHLVLVERT